MEGLKDRIIKRIKSIIKMITKIILIKLLPIILIFLGIYLLIASILYVITLSDGTYNEGDLGNTGYAVSELATSKVSIETITKSESGEGYYLGLDLDEAVNNIIKILEEEHGVLDKYIRKDKQAEYLKAFIKAEIITQYPDLRSKNKIGTISDNNELQGIIQIKRASAGATDGQTETLSYMDYETFQKELSSKNEGVFEYFTLDEECNLIVATWNKVTTNIDTNIEAETKAKDHIEYSITTRKINYRSIIDTYIMPFDFLWALTVTGKDAEFAYEVAKLALNSEIIITAYDNTYTVVDEELEEYKEERKINTLSTVINQKTGQVVSTNSQDSDVSEKEKYKKTTIKTEMNNIEINLTYADIWLLTYKKEFKNQISSEHIEGPLGSNLNPDTTWKKEESSQRSNFSVDFKYNYLETNYKRTIEHTMTNTRKTNSNQYISNTPIATEKTDRNSTEKNFVTLLNQYQNARSKILSASSWLFEILENGPKTADMVDIVRYLLYKTTERDFGITNLDLDIFNAQEISYTGTNILGETIEEKVWFSLRNMKFSEYAVAGVMGNIYAESGFSPKIMEQGSGIGFGLCQWSYERRSQLEAYSLAKGVSAGDANTQIEFLMAELTPGGGANGYATYQLMTTFYTGTTYEPEDWINANNVEDATKAFCYTFERPKQSASNLQKRINKAEEYYEKFKGKTIDNTIETNFIQLRIAQIAQDSEKYGISAKRGYCLAWVNDVYQLAGAVIEREDCAYCSGYYFGVSRDFSKVPIGAAVYGESYTTDGIKYGHVGIYIGNGMVADNIGYVRITTLEKWTSSFPNGCWGWTSSTPVNNHYPVTIGLIHQGRH